MQCLGKFGKTSNGGFLGVYRGMFSDSAPDQETRCENWEAGAYVPLLVGYHRERHCAHPSNEPASF